MFLAANMRSRRDRQARRPPLRLRHFLLVRRQLAYSDRGGG